MSFRTKGTGRVPLPFGLDYADVLSVNTKEDPTLKFPVHGPVKPAEEAVAKQSIAFAKVMLDGPFYTGGSTAEKSASDGIARHSDKYKKVKRSGLTIDEHPFQVELFPEELHAVMGVNKKKKKVKISSYKANGGSREYAVDSPDMTPEERLAKLKDMAETLDADPSANRAEEDDDDDDLEDEFEDDDDDDYNAEKYFDDGEDDVDDGDDEAAF